MENIIVIGAGASGLTSSIAAKNNDNNVIILEKNNVSGKKILITGNGKCNYMNDDFDIKHYNSSNIDVLERIINDKSKQEIIDFFDSLGILSKIKNGYYYPFSNQAITIREALVNEARVRGVDIKYNTEVLDISYKDNKFSILTNNGVYKCDKLVVSTGGMAKIKTGSDGFAYSILKKFNHNVIKPLPALTPLICKSNYLKESKGVRTDVIVNAYENGVYMTNSTGELQITNDGISGICVFQISSKVIKSLSNKNKVTVGINFLPTLNINNANKLVKFLDERNNGLINRTVSNLLDGLLNYNIVNSILKLTNINRDLLWIDLSLEEKENIADHLVNFLLEIDSKYSFENCQVTQGGIPLNEINIETMESKKQKNLYLTGELLDVDGECGGYNLAFAWLTGILVGKNISK